MSTAVYKCAACDSLLETEDVDGVTCVQPCHCVAGKVSPERQELRDRLHRMVREKYPNGIPPMLAPRYDDVFYEGVKWLDENG